jgi:hypothetical protein
LRGRSPNTVRLKGKGFEYILLLNVSGGIFVAGFIVVSGKKSLVLAKSAQANWRFCNKCQAMFYNRFNTKGVCPAGGSHVAQGLNFILPYDTLAANKS